MKKAETPSLTYSPRNAWDVYTTATQKRQMDALVKRYMDFLSNCKTERETVAYVQKRLQEAGFSEDFKKNTVFRNLRGKAIFAAMRYTLGPSPYGYKGLGDIYVFVFFGLVSVLGGYFIVSHTLYWRILLPAVAIGAFSTAVLNVNNIRDMKTDAATRITTPLKIGLKWARVYQTALIATGWAAMTAYSCLRMYDLWHYLFVITLPLFIIHLKGVWTREGKELDGMLPLLVMATFLFALCAGLGFVVFLF